MTKQLRQLKAAGYSFSGEYFRYGEKELAKECAAKFRSEGLRARVVTIETKTSTGYSIYIKEK